MLEHFVEAELEHTLHRVTEESRCPTARQASNTVLANRNAETFDERTVLARVDLDAALDQVKRHNSGVCQTTAQNTTNTAQSVVLVAAILAAVLTGYVTQNQQRKLDITFKVLDVRVV